MPKIIIEYFSPIHYASFDISGAKNGSLLTPQGDFKVVSDIVFWTIQVQNSLKSHFLRKTKSTNFCLKGFKRSVMNRVMMFYKNMQQNNRLQETVGLQKSAYFILMLFYEVLWIHVNDAMCISLYSIVTIFCSGSVWY